ncbi:MAG: hypothetical protein ACI9XO_002522 [Paraglaciecola sp.]
MLHGNEMSGSCIKSFKIILNKHFIFYFEKSVIFATVQNDELANFLNEILKNHTRIELKNGLLKFSKWEKSILFFKKKRIFYGSIFIKILRIVSRMQSTMCRFNACAYPLEIAQIWILTFYNCLFCLAERVHFRSSGSQIFCCKKR